MPLTALITTIKKNLLPEDWPIVLAALQQDPFIWQTLADSFPSGFDGLMDKNKATGWSLANLSLAALQMSISAASLRADSRHPLPAQWRQQVANSYQTFRQENSPAQPDLTRSGKLALALRERRRLTGGWDAFGDDLSPHPFSLWKRPLACLFGMASDVDALLRAVLPFAIEQHAVDEIVQIILCQPISPAAQSQFFSMLCEGLSLKNQALLLTHIQAQRPQLAGQLAQELIQQQAPSKNVPADDFIYQAKICQMAASFPQAQILLSQAWEHNRRQQASLAAQMAEIAEQSEDYHTALTAWEQSIQLHPSQQEYIFRRVGALLQCGCPQEAVELLPAELSEDTSPYLAVAKADLAFHLNDLPAAHHAALHAFHHLPEPLQPRLTRRLIHLLRETGQWGECIHLCESALQTFPQMMDLWPILAQARREIGLRPAAIQAAHIATGLAPKELAQRRLLASLLEEEQDWDQALSERRAIAELQKNVDQADQLALANCALQAGNPTLSLKVGQKVLAEQPNHVAAHTLCGEASFALGNHESAQEHFQQATALAPQNPSPWLALARAHNQAGQFAERLETLQAACLAVPDNVDILLALGEAHLEQSSPSQAMESLKKAGQLLNWPPEKISALEAPQIRLACLLSQAQFSLGHLSAARQTLEPAYQHAPANPQVAEQFAQIALNQKDYAAAIPALTIIMQAQPDALRPKLDTIQAVLATRQNLQSALSIAEQALESHPNHAETLAWYAEALRANQQFAKAMDIYRQALQTPLALAQDWRARLNLGLGCCALQLDQNETALAALQQSEQYNPKNPETLKALAQAYFRANLQEEALNSARKALQQSPAQIEQNLWFSEMALACHAPQEAVGALQHAVELSPGSCDLLFRLAQIQQNVAPQDAWGTYHQLLAMPDISLQQLQQAANGFLDLKDVVSAKTCLEKGLQGHPEPLEKAALLAGLARTAQMDGDFSGAVQYIEQARKLNPQDASLPELQANIFMAMERPRAAHACLEEALRLSDSPARLHADLITLLTTIGDYSAALEHARNWASLEPQSLTALLACAQVHIACLQPDQAIERLSAMPEQGEDVLRMDGWCLLAELNLEKEAEVAAADALTHAQQINPQDARVLALQARMIARRGDRAGGENMLQQLLEAHAPSSRLRRPMAMAARELGQWEYALNLLRAEIEENSLSAQPHLDMAITLTLRAEEQRLAGQLDILNHAPGASALDSQAVQEFEQAILQASRLAEKQTDSPQSVVDAWYARGMSVFQPSPEHAQAMAEHPTPLAGNSAYLAALRNSGDLAQASKVALAWLNGQKDSSVLPPLLLTQLALSILSSHPQRAFILAHTAAQHSASDPRGMALLARVARQQGDIDTAIQALESAISTWPDEPRWRALIAHDYQEKEGKDSPNALNLAAKHLEKTVSLEPQNAAHHLELGKTLLSLGRVEEAIPALVQTIALDANQNQANLLLAKAYVQLQNLEEAAQYAAKAAQTVNLEEGQQALFLQAEIALQKAQPNQALEFAKRAKKQQPNYASQIYIARAYAALAQPKKALLALDEGFDEHNIERKMGFQRAKVLSDLQEAQLALDAWQQLSRRFPEDPKILSGLAEALAANHQQQPAILAAQRALKVASDGATAEQLADLHILVGKLYRQANQLDVALHHIQSALTANPQQAEGYEELGKVYQARREFPQAIDAFRQVLALHPKDHRVYYQLGMLHKETKDYSSAEHLLKQASELDPHNTDYRRQWGSVFALNLAHHS